MTDFDRSKFTGGDYTIPLLDLSRMPAEPDKCP